MVSVKNFFPEKNNICAVIVTYHPDNGIKRRALDILSQVGGLVIVDNNSSDDELDSIKEIVSLNNCCLIRNKKNLGIATALNLGVAWAKQNGYKWSLLMDQDSSVEKNMIDVLIEVFNSYDLKDKLAVIGSNYNHKNIENYRAQHTFEDDSPFVEKKTVITSGSLLSIPIFESLGSFIDEFFIDHVDDEYCLRAWNNGFRIVLSCRPTMVHSLGDLKVHKLFDKTLETSNHSPMRRYYMTRNHIALIKKYFFIEYKWVKQTVYVRLVAFILMCFFEKKKLKKLGAVVLGAFHGVFNINFKKVLED